MLGRVHASLQRSGPGRGVDACPFVFGAFDRLPVHKQSDRIFGVIHTVVRLARRYPRGSARNYSSGDSLVLQNPATDIDMVRR